MKVLTDKGHRAAVTWGWAAMVWAAFAALLWMLRACCQAGWGAELGWFGLLTVAEASLLTLPLLFVSRRWRWTLWVVLALLSVFVLVNVVYWRRFAALMPYTTMFWWGNFDAMVLDASLDSLRLSDLCFAIPLFVVLLSWIFFFRQRVDEAVCHCRMRLWLVFGVFALWGGGTALSAIKYYGDYMADDAEQSVITAFAHKFVGERLNRTAYLKYNGLISYGLWNLRDFSPAIDLSRGEIERIERFIAKQVALDEAAPLPVEIPSAAERRPNFLLIMVESLESWPIDYRVDGRSAMPVLDSLIHNAPGTLFWPNIASQISVGTSSDGHMMGITGILPLRDYAASEDFADNCYPSLFFAFKELGYHTFEITCDDPRMWNQERTWRSWGFDVYKNHNDIDPKHESSWSQRDSYWAEYVADYVSGAQQPWAGMAITLSLHSPYRSELKFYERFDGKGIDPESVHYLKMCCLDDAYISQILDALREKGIYDNTVIAITGDHMAHGLFDSHRPREIAGQPKHIPLIILNAPLASRIDHAPAGQIDIYPTLLDVCGLSDYTWRGVGLSLLRHGGRGSVNRLDGATSVPTEAELHRQREAWEVSRLILAGNYFVGKNCKR